ncbi:MAG: YdeI/OmpD-associated family protein [Gammaproteobacteria bacterium]|nr:YdeI/OmpD-associated family protein [Gammaproteobacteria bacterium]
MTDVIDIPNELAEMLSQNGNARAAFEKLSPSHRNEYARWVSEAKRQETRVRRARKTLDMLLQ